MNQENEIGGTALAAFTLSQFVLWAMLEHGFTSQAEAVSFLQQAVTTNRIGGRANQAAAGKLAIVLQALQAWEPPPKH